MRKLNVMSGPAAGQSVEVESELVIGREGADITIDDEEMSRRHVVVRPVEGGVEVEDAGSMNGTFVNGERITDPVTLTTNGKIRLGKSEIEVVVEEAPPAEAAAAPVAEPDVTRQRDVVADPSVTRQQAIVPEPDVTRQRDVVAEPDVTRQREVVAGPDVTRQRDVVAEPDATRQREVVAGPDVTRQREVVAEPDATRQRPVPPPPGGPPGAPPEAGPGGPPGAPAGAPPGPPPAAPKAAKPGGRRSFVPILIGLLVLIAVAIVLFLVLSGGDDDAEAHPLRAVATTNILSAPAQTMTVVGVMVGSPIGRMSADIVRRVSAQPTPGGPVVPLRLTFLFTQPGGSFRADMRGRTWHTKGDREEVRGKAAVTDGTGKYDGVKGSFNVFGDNPPNTALSKFSVRGKIEY
jgi:hypothetical protein